MGTLQNWPRQVNTSPVEVLDIIKANIRVLADALSVEFATESTVLVFEQAVGETRSWSVAVNGVTVPAVNGVAEVIVERDTEVDYQILVEGGADVSGSLIAMGPNLGIQLERFEPVGSEYTVTITSTTPGAVVMINGVEGTTLTVDAGSTVTWEVSAGDDWVAQSGTIESISANYTQAVTLVTAWSYEVPQVSLSYGSAVPVTGGTVSPTLSYTQVAHNVNTGDSTITTGGVVAYTISQQAAATVAQSGDVTFVSAGTAIETAPATATVTVTVALNGQTGRASAPVSRVANTIQSVALSASATEVTPVFSGAVAAGGGSGSYHIIGTLLSGAVVSVPGLSVLSVESWASFADGTYTISSRGTEVGEERTSALSISVAASQSQAEVSWSGEVSQEANAAIYAAPVVSAFAYGEVPAAGGTAAPSALVYSQAVSYTSGASGEAITGDLASPAAGVAITYSAESHPINTNSGEFSVVGLGTVVTEVEVIDTVSVTVALNGESGEASAEVSQAANTVSYSEPVVSLSYADIIPASGGSASPTLSYVQTATYASGDSSEISEGGSVTYAGSVVDSETGDVSAASLETTESEQATVDTVTATVALNGKSGSSAAVPVYQAANVATYGASVVVSGFAYSSSVSAAGGSVSPDAGLSYSLAVSYTSGSSSEITTGGSISYAADSLSWGSVDPSTGAVTASSRGTEVGDASTGSVIVTVSIPGVGSAGSISGSAEAAVTQEANAATYASPVVSLAYSTDIPASGGVAEPTLSYVQSVTYTSGDSAEVSSGGAVTYAGGSVDASSGEVTGSDLGTTEQARTVVDTVTATVVLNGQSGSSAGVPVYQAANVATYGDSVEVSGFAYPASAISAAGGSASPEAGLAYSLSVSYTSGASSTITSGGTISYSSSIDWGELDSETGEVTASSRGTEVGDVNTAQVAVQVSVPAGDGSVSGSAEATVTQEANTAVYAAPVVSLSYASDIPANGGSVDPTLSYTQEVTYTSGETSDITSGGEVTYSGTSVNTSTGAVTGADLSTTVQERSVVDTVTASVSLNGQAGTSSAVEVYQAANVASYGESVVISGFAYPSSAIAAAGGSQSPEGGMTYSLSVSYTSGASSSITEGGSVSYTSPIDWGSVDPESGEVTAASRGTTAGEANTAQVTATVTISGVGSDGSISGSAEAAVTQEANTASYGVPVLVKGSYEEFPAEGATKTPSETTYTQQVTYTSGSTDEVSSGATITYNMDSTAGFTLDSTETGQLTAAAQEPGQPTRSANVTVTVSVNGQSASDTIVASQAAGAAAA